MTNSLASIPTKLLAVFERVKTTVTITAAPTYVVASGGTTGTPTSYSVTNASPVIEDQTMLAAGSAQRAGNASCFLPGSGLGFVPLVGWTLTAGSGKPWKIVDVIAHAIDESTVAAWELRLER
jgi:hypothetical protein